MAWDLKQCNSDITVYSDASVGWGCGAFADELWFQLEWPPQVKDFSIGIKELIPVVVSAALFWKAWSGRLGEFKVDNIRSSHSRTPINLLQGTPFDAPGPPIGFLCSLL